MLEETLNSLTNKMVPPEVFVDNYEIGIRSSIPCLFRITDVYWISQVLFVNLLGYLHCSKVVWFPIFSYIVRWISHMNIQIPSTLCIVGNSWNWLKYIYFIYTIYTPYIYAIYTIVIYIYGIHMCVIYMLNLGWK